MTSPAGSIGIGVSLDATDLSSDLTRAVEKSLKPALASIEKTLDALVKDFAKLDGKQFQDVARSAAKAEAAVEGVSKETQKAGNAATGVKRTADAYDDVAKKARKAADATKDIGKGGGGGSGLLDGIKSKLSGLASAGKSAGSSMGEGIIAGAAPRLAGLGAAGGPIGLALTAAAALGIGAGALLAKNIFAGMDTLQSQANVAAKLGLSPEQMKPIAAASAAAYASNFGESVEANMDSARAAIQSGLLDPGSSEASTKKIVEQLNTVADVMGEEIPHVAKAASQAIKTGLATDATGAFDLFVKAQQNGLNVSEDFIDTITEYGTQFRQLGLAGPEALGLISQAVKGGARDTDTAADALKEFAIRAIDGSKTSADAYAAAGLSAEDYTKRIAQGGPVAKQAFSEVLDAIRGIKDPVQQNAVAVGLFGTKAEDLGQAFKGLDLHTAVQQFGEVGGAAQRASDTMGGTAAGAFESLKRSVETSMSSVQVALAEAFGPKLAEIANWITAHKEEIAGFFIDLGKAAVVGFGFIVNMVGQVTSALASIIKPIGDVVGGMLKVQELGARLGGNTEEADKIKAQADAAFGWGEGLEHAGEAMRNFNPNELVGKLDAVKQDLIDSRDNAALLATGIETLPDGHTIVIKDDSAEAQERLKQLGYDVQRLPDGHLTIAVVYRDNNGNVIDPSQLVRQAAVPGEDRRHGGRADGGVLPGYSPGVDNMMVPMSGGEGVIIPEAMRALGGNWLYDLNSRFRSGISRRGYSGGGVVGFDGGGVVPTLTPEQQTVADTFVAALAPVVGLLAEVRDILKTSDQANSTTADATTTLASSASTGGTAPPLGLNTPTTDQAAALAPFSAGLAGLVQSGDYKGLSQFGIPEDSPIVDALLKARAPAGGDNTALLAALKTLTDSGDYKGLSQFGLPEDSPVIDELLKLREAVVRNGVDGGKKTGLVAFAGSDTPLSATPGGRIDQAVSLAKNAAAKGSYSYGSTGGASNTLYDCSGLMSDLFAVLTGKPYTGTERYLTTESDFPGLGFVEGYDPASPFNVGINRGGGGPNSHIVGQINGTNVEAGGGTGGIAYGANAADPRSMQLQYHLPADLVGEIAGAGATAAAGAGGDACGCIGDQMSGNGTTSPMGDTIAGALTSALSATLPGLMNDLIDALLQVPANQSPERQAALDQLIRERNPAGIASAAGLEVGDYSKAGGGPDAQADQLQVNDGPGFAANGQMYSDTAALLDRTLTSLEQANQARHEQLLGIMTQVRDQLTEKILKPTLEAGVSSGIEGIGTATSAAIGASMGQAAAEPIASAVGSAVAANMPAPTAAPAAAPAPAIPGLAGGGGIVGPGTSTSDSILARLSHGEYVLPASDVARLGGFAGVDALRRSLPGFATGGGVNANAVVGAEFFGVSEVPILGLLINVLVQLLLAVLGVEIEARDTLNEMTDQFRDFRGEFAAFDASGRLMNDTSALVDRSGTSKDEATQERIRILKIVIQELIKYIIEKVIVPLAKAAANAALSAAGSAASGAISGALPTGGQLLGGLTSSLITGVGGAGVDVLAEVGSSLAVNLSGILVDGIGDALTSYLPGLTSAVFGAGLGPIADLFTNLVSDPILSIFGNLSNAISGLFGTIFSPLLGGFAGILGIAGLGGAAGGGLFDAGGLANGQGMMPKAVLAPERVLSPKMTPLFDRFIGMLAEGKVGGSSSSTVIHAPFTVIGNERGGRDAHSRLLELMS